MSNRKAFQELKLNGVLKTVPQALKFIDILDSLDPSDLTLLPDILYLFDDNVVEIEPLKYLVDFVGKMEIDSFITNLVLVTPHLSVRANGWLQLLYYGVLCNEVEIGFLIKALTQATDIEREAVLRILDEIKFADNISVIADKLNSRVRIGIQEIKKQLQ